MKRVMDLGLSQPSLYWILQLPSEGLTQVGIMGRN